MIKHNVITILKNLSLKEVSSFKNFLNSPYHNRSKKIKSLYKELIKFYPGFNQKKFTKENIFRKVSGNSKYRDSTFRVLMYDLLRLLQNFLINESFKKKNTSYLILLLKEFHDRRYFSLLESQIRKSEKVINEDKYDYNFFYNKYLIESYKYNYITQNSPVISKSSLPRQLRVLSGSNTFLTLFFITELISDYTSLIISSAKYNVGAPDSFSEKILMSIDIRGIFSAFKKNRDYEYVINLYSLLYSLYSSIDSREKYEEYRNSVRKSEQNLSPDEISFHYSRLISCCILNQNTTKSLYYRKELFNLYRRFLQKEFYKDNKTNYLPSNLYRTIILNALRLKKYQWARNFIEKYSSKVREGDRTNIYNWGYAFLHNKTGDNRKAIEYINKIKVNYFIFKYDIYNIRLKIYFEDERPDTVFEYIHTYKEFLRNDSFFSEERKVQYKNFVKSVEYLLKFKEKRNSYYIEYLKNNFLIKSEVINKDWLKEKINDMEKTIK